MSKCQCHLKKVVLVTLLVKFQGISLNLNEVYLKCILLILPQQRQVACFVVSSDSNLTY